MLNRFWLLLSLIGLSVMIIMVNILRQDLSYYMLTTRTWSRTGKDQNDALTTAAPPPPTTTPTTTTTTMNPTLVPTTNQPPSTMKQTLTPTCNPSTYRPFPPTTDPTTYSPTTLPTPRPTNRKCHPNFNSYTIQTSNQEGPNKWLKCNVSAGIYSDCDEWYLFGNRSFVVIAEDDGPCTAYGFWRGDIVKYGGHRSSGGEFRLCQRLAELFIEINYHVIFLHKIPCATEFFGHLVRQGKNKIVITHGGWEQIPARVINGIRIPMKPFSECLYKIDYFGTDGKSVGGIWPGDTSRYITSFPNHNNTYIGAHVELCERRDLLAPGQERRQEESNNIVKVSVDPTDRSLIVGHHGERYAVVIGKWNEEGQVNNILPIFRNGQILNYAMNMTNLVLLSCPNRFFEVTNTSRESGRFVCLSEKSYWRTTAWRSLVRNAQVLIGLGPPAGSPTPVEALSCLVPVILPFGQHQYMEQHVSEPASFTIRTVDEFIRAADKVLRHGNITISIVEEVTRRNFQDLIQDRPKALLHSLRQLEKACARQISIWANG